MSTRESKLHALNIAQLRTTRNTIRPAARQAAIESLDAMVASAIDLALAARQANWNVRGSQFSALHEVFGRTSDELYKHADVLAERSAALGGIPRCSPQSVVAATKLKSYPSFGVDGAEHVAELAARLANLSTELRQAIIDINHQGDPVTAHLFTGAGATVDHLLWLMESQAPFDESGRATKVLA